MRQVSPRAGGRCAAVQRRAAFARASNKSAASRGTPWQIGYQCNERYLQWDASAQAQLLKLTCAEKLHWSIEQVEEGLQGLTALLPDLPSRLSRIKAALLIDLLSEQQLVADNLLALKAAFPGADALKIASADLSLLLGTSPPAIERDATRLREALPDIDALDELVESEPRLLRADVEAMLQEAQRLMPGHEPQRALVLCLQRLMDMETQGMRSSLEDEPGLAGLRHHSKG